MEAQTMKKQLGNAAAPTAVVPGQEQTLTTVEPQQTKETRQPISWAEGVEYITKRLDKKTLSPSELVHLEMAFHDNPMLWRIVGDITLHTEDNLIGKISDQAVVGVAVRRGVQELRESLGQRDAPGLEKLLIDRVILCWLNLNQIQRAYDRQLVQSITLTLGMYWEKRLTMAQTRYTKAIEMLARVRRLSRAVPLQVNIGGQQINVAGAAGE
jgi:hypothetical protein